MFLLYSVWRWRARPGDELGTGRPSTATRRSRSCGRSSPRSSWSRSRSPAASCWSRTRRPPRTSWSCSVTGQQFDLDVHLSQRRRHPRAGARERPADRVRHHRRSMHDVIHSFYVPQFRVKADAVPGIMNHTYATPDRVGTLRPDLHRAVRPRPLADARAGARRRAETSSTRGWRAEGQRARPGRRLVHGASHTPATLSSQAHGERTPTARSTPSRAASGLRGSWIRAIWVSFLFATIADRHRRRASATCSGSADPGARAHEVRPPSA